MTLAPTSSRSRSTTSLALSLALALAGGLAACAPAGSPGPSDSPDGGADKDGGERRCVQVPPRLGDTPAAKALASAPQQCDQPAYKWLDSQSLGDIASLGITDTIAAAASQVLLSAAKVQPAGPLHEVAVEQLGYMTQDRGKLISATALMAYPSDGNRQSATDVLLVLHGTAGFTDRCAPSSDPDTRGLVAALASLGYVVIAPDYIGLRGVGVPTGFLHPYLIGQATAIAALDAVRAASKRLAMSGSPACAATRFATVGGSQGGHAALWVDRLASYYAPELTHVGVVATVPPADLLSEGTRALRAAVPATLNMAAFFGASSDWYGLKDRLSEVFVPPLDKDIPAALATSCDPSGTWSGKGLSDVFQKKLLDAAAVDGGVRGFGPWGCLAVENGLTTTSIPFVPSQRAGYGIMFVLGESDTLVNPPIERTSFDTLCAGGMPLQYLECAGAGHVQATQWALPEIVDFLTDRYAGKALDPATRCKRSPAVRCRATP